MKVVGGIHASVHALLISGDSALDPDPLWCRSKGKLLKVIYIDGRLIDWWGGRRSYLLWVKQQPAQGKTPPPRETVDW